MSKVANDIIQQHIAAIEKGKSPHGEMFSALHFLWFNSCSEEQKKLDAILKSLNDRGIRSHLSEIRAFPFPSVSAGEIILEKVRAIESEEVESVTDAISEAMGEWNEAGHCTDSFMSLVGLWLDEEIRKVLPKLKEHPFVDPHRSA